MILFSIIYFDEKTPHPSVYTAIPIVGTMLIIWFSGRGELITSVLSSLPFKSIGLLSYSLYLWHWLIFFVRSSSRKCRL